MRRYLVCGSLIVDRVLPKDGIGEIRISPGGGAAYALTGIKIWNDDCMLNCYTGNDFDGLYREWMDRNGFDWSGIKRIYERMTFLDLYYRDDGVHEMATSDDSVDLDDLPQFELVEPFLKEDPSGVAVHITHGDVREMLKELRPFREKGLKVGYEMNYLG